MLGPAGACAVLCSVLIILTVSLEVAHNGSSEDVLQRSKCYDGACIDGHVLLTNSVGFSGSLLQSPACGWLCPSTIDLTASEAGLCC